MKAKESNIPIESAGRATKSFDINNIKLEIQSLHFRMDDVLENYLITHIERLGKTFSRIERCEITLSLEKNSQKKNCIVEAKIFVPGNVLFAKEKHDNFRLCAKMVFDDLYEQLNKFKEKLTDKTNSRQSTL